MLGAFFSTLALNCMFLILYIQNTNAFPKPLPAAKEREYLEACHDGDAAARGLLIEHNLRLVAHIVKKYYSLNNEQEDLISIGTVGLIKAVDSFKSDKGTRLATYASRCIENEILMYFRNLKKTSVEVSIDEAIDTDKDGNTLTLMDVISVDDCILDSLDKKMKIKKLKNSLAKLDEREKMIIIMRYGLQNNPPLTQLQTAKKLGISRSYVSRIEKRSLGFLKKSLEENQSF